MYKFLDIMVAADASRYSRLRDLKKLLAWFPGELENETVAGTEHIVCRLERAADAQGVIRKHWSYDLNRHLALLAALRAERSHLACQLNAQASARLISGMTGRVGRECSDYNRGSA